MRHVGAAREPWSTRCLPKPRIVVVVIALTPPGTRRDAVLAPGYVVWMLWQLHALDRTVNDLNAVPAQKKTRRRVRRKIVLKFSIMKEEEHASEKDRPTLSFVDHT